MAEKILVVDDEISLQETLTYNLKKEGYLVEVAGDGITALELFRKSKPDLVILDVMLPGMDGFEICRTLRQESNTPVLMLTARDDEIDRVVGLEHHRRCVVDLVRNIHAAHAGDDEPLRIV